MSDQEKKAFDFASDASKQLITLATGVVALTVTFAKDFVGKVPADTKSLLTWAWIVLLVSILLGVVSLLAMTGALGRTAKPDIYARSITVPAIAQVLTFLFGIGLTIWFGAKAFLQ